MTTLIEGATLIDGVSEAPVTGAAILIEGDRILEVGLAEQFGGRTDLERIDASGRFVIPGLMNANVHLLMDVRLENLVRFQDRYEALIEEAAQVALKNGVTTVFDTYGPRRHLMASRDRIARGETPGSRIFCAGNIVGLDGPCSADFFAKAEEVASAAVVDRINAIWVENVGRHLMWLGPDEVAHHVRRYIEKGIDFVKYASNEHFGASHGAFLAFSPRVQAAIVAAAHEAGLTAQAHTMSVEGLHMAVEAGADLIQHANHTGPVEIPSDTIDLIGERGTWAVIFPMLQRRLDWLLENESYRGPTEWKAADANTRRFIASDARILMATDGLIYAPEAHADPFLSKVIKTHGTPGVDNLFDLATGHFIWLEAMVEKGCAPMRALQAATINVARAYGKDQELGTIEAGKIADLLILHKDPLADPAHYRTIHAVVKDGRFVDMAALPLEPLLTRPLAPPEPEEADYIRFLGGGTPLPMCPTCIAR